MKENQWFGNPQRGGQWTIDRHHFGSLFSRCDVKESNGGEPEQERDAVTNALVVNAKSVNQGN